MSEWINSCIAGVQINVKVIPNSSKNQLSLLDENIKINIIAPALENKANKEIVKFLSKVLGVKKKELSIIRGNKEKYKQILIKDHTFEEIERKINSLIN